MNYIKNAKKVFRLKKYLDNYIDNPNKYNLIILESFLEQLGFYIKNDEAYKENYKIKITKLKYFLSNLITIIQSNMEYSKKQDIINIFATIQAEFQQPSNQEYKNVYIFDNKRQLHPSGYFHSELSQKINKKYENIINTKINNKTIKKISRSRDKSTGRSRSRDKSTARSRSRT